MKRRLEAHDLAAGRLALIKEGEGEFRVEAGGFTAGQIMSRRRSFGRTVWFWSLSGPHLPESMPPAGSNAMSLEGAKAAVKSAFDAWLQGATGQRGDIAWSKPPPNGSH